ncbi:ArsR family transcriptional regulator [Paenibacillus swuensis]|uniref:ArsR family transcriptional regulator n=1 Tax=Paenibacillus swuensis TaxID=1178515 RepID=A0A172TM51_9BACL|nr:metalloregulator ArsR/SmtB family transcription factor [Paenibacillus swuensis]ANE48036.1 ArsR family transcriptional regulator [Paenibacillus swuensis]
MQLDKLVSFHKAVGDVTRIRILAMLKDGPLHGQALAGKLGVTPPTITHHMTKLREVGLVFERRDKNNVYFHLDEKSLKQQAGAIVNKVTASISELDGDEAAALVKEKQSVIRNFFAGDGTLKQMPAQRKKKLYVLEHMAATLQPNQKYTEKEINEFIKRYHPDFATIRREFIMGHYMYRENDVYELNPREMWGNVEG